MKLKQTSLIAAAGATMLFASAAYPHTFGAPDAGFSHGLAHPFLGIDHLLAMIAVGTWSAQQGGSALWRVPLAFLSMMVVGALVANPDSDASVIEMAVATSVLALGLLIALSVRAPQRWSMTVVGAFALFHGYAHGLELSQTASPWAYGLGFLAATASLHALGILMGVGLSRQTLVLRSGGAALALAGLWLIAAA